MVLTSKTAPDQASAASATTPKIVRKLKTRLALDAPPEDGLLAARRQKAGKFKVIPRRLATWKV
jgi:hypothetical protein